MSVESSTTSKVNYKIDLLRILFAFAVMLAHTNQLQNANGKSIIFSGGWLAVDFFFVVSGFFMAEYALEKIKNETDYSTCKYIVNNIKTLFPYVLFSFIICCFIRYGSSPKDLIKGLFGGVYELLFVRMSGVKSWYSNDLTWYLSAMIISKMILFPLLLKFKHKFTLIFCPISVILLIGYLSYNYGRIGLTYTWTGIAYVGLLRSFIGLMSGCICYELSLYFRKIEFTTFGRFVFKFLVLFFLIDVTIFMCFRDQISPKGDLDYICFFLICSLVTLVLSEQSLISNRFSFFSEDKIYKICKFLRKYSLSIYLNQYIVLLFLKRFYFVNSFFVELLIYVFMTLVISLFALLVVIIEKKLAFRVKKLLFKF